MAWSLLNAQIAPSVTALLDEIDKGNEGRPDMENRAMPRERAESIIHACLWAYSSRSSDFAGAYAMDAFANSVGKDLATWVVGLLEFNEKAAASSAAKIGEGGE